MNIESFKKNIKEFDLDVNFKKFCNFNMFEIGSWSQVVMYCALRGNTVDFDDVKFFMYCSLYLSNIRKMFLHTIYNTIFLDKFLTEEFVAVLYKVTSKAFLYNMHISKLSKKLDIFIINNSAKFNNDIVCESELKPFERFEMLDAIDKKSPIALLKFFNDNKRQLWQYDAEFVRYVYERTKNKANNMKGIFVDIYTELLKDRKQQLNLNMFMN